MRYAELLPKRLEARARRGERRGSDPADGRTHTGLGLETTRAGALGLTVGLHL